MKNKKGFTLVELLAVIVILGIIMVIATKTVMDYINESKVRTRYIAAKEIVEIASAYMEVEGSDENNCVTIVKMICTGYLENDTTNPKTGENGFAFSDDSEGKDCSGKFSGEDVNQKVCKDEFSAQESYEVQEDENEKYYDFDGYRYVISE